MNYSRWWRPGLRNRRAVARQHLHRPEKHARNSRRPTRPRTEASRRARPPCDTAGIAAAPPSPAREPSPQLAHPSVDRARPPRATATGYHGIAAAPPSPAREPSPQLAHPSVDRARPLGGTAKRCPWKNCGTRLHQPERRPATREPPIRPSTVAARLAGSPPGSADIAAPQPSPNRTNLPATCEPLPGAPTAAARLAPARYRGNRGPPSLAEKSPRTRELSFARGIRLLGAVARGTGQRP